MSAAAVPVSVRASFRTLLRAHRSAFAGDLEMIATAQRTTRAEFDKGVAEVASGEGAPVEERLESAAEAARFLRENVVQAPLNARGNYEVSAGRIRSDK